MLDNWYPSVTDGNGLLQKGLNGTAGYGDYAFLGRTGEVTYYNALYVLALQDAARLATALGHSAQAESGVRGPRPWPRPSTPTSGIPRPGPTSTRPSAMSGTGRTATATRSCPGRRRPIGRASALNYLSTNTALPYGNSFMDNDTLVSDGSQRVYAFTSYPEISARFLTGSANSAIDEIKRLYGWMATHDPGHTDWEGIGAGGSMYEGAYTSAAHGWSTGVVSELTNDLLGASPVTPGYATWAVTPHPGTVKWAQGQLPTPHGPLDVSWSAGKKSFTLMVSAPRGTSGSVTLPVSGTVYLDGHRVSAGALTNLRGSHTVVVRT